jgi:hypothetical protein
MLAQESRFEVRASGFTTLGHLGLTNTPFFRHQPLNAEKSADCRGDGSIEPGSAPADKRGIAPRALCPLNERAESLFSGGFGLRVLRVFRVLLVPL